MKKKTDLALSVIVLVAVGLVIVYLSIHYVPFIMDLLQRDEFQRYILGQGWRGVLIFILLQIAQVVVAAIPGDVVQVAGGYFFGTLWGTVYLTVGVILGSFIAFGITRLFGYRLLRKFVAQDKLDKFCTLLSGRKSELLVFLLFAIPGLPKDILIYIGGLTPMHPYRFVTLSVLGRLPAITVSAYIGANLGSGNVTLAIVAVAAATCIFLVGWLWRDKALATLQKVWGRTRRRSKS